MKSVDLVIMEVLSTNETEISTYEIAKQLNISWDTVKRHCYKMKAERLIKMREAIPEVGEGKKMLWRL